MTAHPAALTPTNPFKPRKRWGEILVPYLFISPFILSFFLLFLGPAIFSLVISFFRYAGYGEATFVGVQNYEKSLFYHVFWTQMRNVLQYWVGHAVPLVVLSFLMALLVNARSVKYKSVVKPMLFLPQLVAAVAAALLFKNFFGTNYGLLNTVIGQQIPWLENMDLARWVVIIVMVWRGMAYWFVIFLAGLTSINTEVMEASIVDGANTVQRLFYITIPLMRRSFLFFFVMDAIGSIRVFETPNVLGSNMGGLAPLQMAPVLNLIIDNIRNALFGQAAATSWLLFVFIAIISWLQFRLFRER